MKLIIFILTNFFGNCDESCYSNDERIRALEIENRSLQQILNNQKSTHEMLIKSNQEMLAKMDDKLFQLATKSQCHAPKSSGLSLHFLNHPFVQEYAITGSGIYNQVLRSNEIKEGVKAILADVFISFNKNDHFVLSFCSQPPCDQNKSGSTHNGGKFNNNFKEYLDKVSNFIYHLFVLLSF